MGKLVIISGRRTQATKSGSELKFRGDLGAQS